jgi:hypothetical protein
VANGDFKPIDKPPPRQKKPRRGMKRSRMKPVSDKRKAEIPAREACMVAVILRSGGKCEMKVPGVCTGHGAHGHEPLLRAQGGDPTDPGQVLLGCVPCHRWAHDNPEKAYAMGLLKRRCTPNGPL